MRKRHKKSSPATDHLAAERSSGFLVRQLKLALKQRQDATIKLANLAEKALHRLHELNCQQPPTIHQLLQEKIQLKTTQRPPSFIHSPNTRIRNHLLHQESPPPPQQPSSASSSSPSNISICIINTLSQSATQSNKKEQEGQRQQVPAPSTSEQQQYPTSNNNIHSSELEKLQYTTLLLTELLKKAEARADRAAEYLANAQKESRELRVRMEGKEREETRGMVEEGEEVK